MSTSERLQLLLTHFKKDQLETLEKRAEGGDAEAQFDLGALYANGRGVTRNPKQAVHWLTKANQGGQVNAKTLLAWLYLNADEGERNPGKAIELYLEAAEAGDNDAQCALGELYEHGAPGIEANTQAMRNWYERAANANHPKAQFALGRLLTEGKRLAQNDEAAFQWLTLAIMNGSEPAQRELTLLTARLKPAQIEQFKQRMMDNLGSRH